MQSFRSENNNGLESESCSAEWTTFAQASISFLAAVGPPCPSVLLAIPCLQTQLGTSQPSGAQGQLPGGGTRASKVTKAWPCRWGFRNEFGAMFVFLGFSLPIPLLCFLCTLVWTAFYSNLICGWVHSLGSARKWKAMVSVQEQTLEGFSSITTTTKNSH